MDERTRSFEGLILSPDYNEHLDLCIVDEENVISNKTAKTVEITVLAVFFSSSV